MKDKYMPQYPEVSHMKLDQDGGYYCRHVEAMTAEALHSKSDIAGQLGLRDREIDRLRAENEALARDAARYRWLRDRAGQEDDLVEIFIDNESYAPGNLDAQVDAAMEAK